MIKLGITRYTSYELQAKLDDTNCDECGRPVQGKDRIPLCVESHLPIGTLYEEFWFVRGWDSSIFERVRLLAGRSIPVFDFMPYHLAKRRRFDLQLDTSRFCDLVLEVKLSQDCNPSDLPHSFEFVVGGGQ